MQASRDRNIADYIALGHGSGHWEGCGRVGSLALCSVKYWNVDRIEGGDGVALSVRDDRRIDSAHLFAGDDARAVHAALGRALASRAAA